MTESPVFLDSDSGSGSALAVNLNPGGSVWGPSMIWGSGVWGGGSLQYEQRVFLQNARGRRIKFKFSNQNKANQKFKVHGLNLLYNIKGYR